MQDATKRRLTLLAAGVLLAAVVTTLTQVLLVDRSVVAAEPYAVVVGLGVSIPLLLAGAYPRTEGSGDSPALLIGAEAAAAIVVGTAVVALLVATDLPDMLSVGAGAAATYVGGTAARAVVVGRPTTDEASAE
ncbi:hypothetical protein JCM30237_07120 [Halolamina litorea]|jgi:hypothetical protein|uniref:Uncharacterized protein n=1 Tax=Halolamina litorea TaxID=1515593 RepID=A0ABD6BPP4_9EURY|nr:hypothetical protein [Halolamina litorea]